MHEMGLEFCSVSSIAFYVEVSSSFQCENMRKFTAQEEVRFSRRIQIDIVVGIGWVLQFLLSRPLLTNEPIYQSRQSYSVFSFHVIKL